GHDGLLGAHRSVGRWLQAVCLGLALLGAATALLDRPLVPGLLTDAARTGSWAPSVEASINVDPLAPLSGLAPAPAPNGSIRRDGLDIVIELSGMPLDEAVARLAVLTHTAVIGTTPSNAAATLSWRGPRAGAAWGGVLAGDADHVLACDLPDERAVCRVWPASAAR